MTASSSETSAFSRTSKLLSVVVPMHDEQEAVEPLYDRVREVLVGLRFELIIVNDASRDATSRLLDSLADADPRVKVLHLARSFGHQAALTAGLEHARGDAVVMMDGDLQDPPEVIREMLDRWRDGFEVVSAVREKRSGETWFKLATARSFYNLFARITKLELPQNAGDFRLLDRPALDA